MSLRREPQLQCSFTPGDPAAGYYNDLTGVARSYGSPRDAGGWFQLLATRREHAWPVSLLQLGLGSWQLATATTSAGDDACDWLDVAGAVAEWAVIDMDGHGRFAHHQPMPHTYDIAPPWYSAMAQGQGASLLVRAATTLDDASFAGQAARAVAPLLGDGLSACQPLRPGARPPADAPQAGRAARGAALLPEAAPMVVATDDGPVLQEYPTNPAAHVLNGWVWALWGLYDVANAGAVLDEALGGAAADDLRARTHGAFEEGVDALVARLPLYEIGRGWSRYDLFPHLMPNIASPFYHRLHIEQLCALHQLAPREAFATHSDRWLAGLDSRTARIAAVARKVGFRLVRPRGKAA